MNAVKLNFLHMLGVWPIQSIWSPNKDSSISDGQASWKNKAHIKFFFHRSATAMAVLKSEQSLLEFPQMRNQQAGTPLMKCAAVF